jgi:hypothetical protein
MFIRQRKAYRCQTFGVRVTVEVSLPMFQDDDLQLLDRERFGLLSPQNTHQ